MAHIFHPLELKLKVMGANPNCAACILCLLNVWEPVKLWPIICSSLLWLTYKLTNLQTVKHKSLNSKQFSKMIFFGESPKFIWYIYIIGWGYDKTKTLLTVYFESETPFYYLGLRNALHTALTCASVSMTGGAEHDAKLKLNFLTFTWPGPEPELEKAL